MWDTVATALVLLAAVLPVVGLVLARRSAVRRHPPVEYDEWSNDAVAGWRWRQPAPELGLRLDDTDDASTLTIGHRNNPVTHVCVAMGYLGIGGLVLMAFGLGEAAHPSAAAIFLVVMGGFCWMLLQVGSTVERFVLTPDRAIVVRRFGWWWERRHVYRPGRLRASGRYQSAFSMNRRQRTPLFIVSIRGRLFESSFMVRVNQTQGSWIVGGLQAWADRPRDEVVAPGQES